MSVFIDEAIDFYCEALSMDDIRGKIIYEELDEIDFFNRVKEITGDDCFSDFFLISVPDEENYRFIVKENLARQKNNFGLEIFYTQLSNVILQEDEKITTMRRIYTTRMFKRAYDGLDSCIDFYAMCLAQRVMELKYQNEDENPYSEDESRRIGFNIMEQALQGNDKTPDERMSMLLYSFSKLFFIPDTDNEFSAGYVYDIRPFIKEEELKKILPKLYEIMAGKPLEELTMFHFIKINTLMKKVYNFFSRDETIASVMSQKP